MMTPKEKAINSLLKELKEVDAQLCSELMEELEICDIISPFVFDSVVPFICRRIEEKRNSLEIKYNPCEVFRNKWTATIVREDGSNAFGRSMNPTIEEAVLSAYIASIKDKGRIWTVKSTWKNPNFEE